MTNTARLFNICIILLMALCSCHQNKKNNNTDNSTINKKTTIAKNTKKIKPQKTDKLIKLTNHNVVAQLTKYGNENPETIVKLITPKGTMTIELYKNTPLHRANFIRLIKNNFYTGTMFYRVVNNFMIQGGDNDDWERLSIKNNMGKYTIPAEFRTANIHKKGALSMARQYKDNDEKRSSSFDFFIVQGTVYNQGQLLGAELEYGLKISDEHKKIYSTIGGTPHLDGQHTVFGQVIDGLNIIDSIAAVKTDEGNWPIDDITISFDIIK